MRTAKAAFTYWLVVFAVGFALGTIRVLWLAPYFGDETAVLIEGPFILGASALAAWWVVDHFAIDTHRQALATGALAFMLLMIAELVLAVTGFAMTPAEWIASLWVPPGLWGLIGQALFALLPAAVVALRDRRHL